MAAPPPIRVMWWGPQRRRGWAFRDPSCETARFPGLAVCPSAGLRHSPSIRVPSETTTALLAKCLWCSAMSPEPTFTLQCEEPKRPEPKHHPVGLPAGSPTQALSAAMRRAPGAEALVGNGASSPIGASCPSPRARTRMCVEPKHPEPKHPVGLPEGSPAQTPSAAIRRAPGAEALVDNEASSWQVRAARPLVRAHECAWSQNTQSQNTRSGCPKAALLRRQARP